MPNRLCPYFFRMSHFDPFWRTGQQGDCRFAAAAVLRHSDGRGECSKDFQFVSGNAFLCAASSSFHPLLRGPWDGGFSLFPLVPFVSHLSHCLPASHNLCPSSCGCLRIFFVSHSLLTCLHLSCFFTLALGQMISFPFVYPLCPTCVLLVSHIFSTCFPYLKNGFPCLSFVLSTCLHNSFFMSPCLWLPRDRRLPLSPSCCLLSHLSPMRCEFVAALGPRFCLLSRLFLLAFHFNIRAQLVVEVLQSPGCRKVLLEVGAMQLLGGVLRLDISPTCS